MTDLELILEQLDEANDKIQAGKKLLRQGLAELSAAEDSINYLRGKFRVETAKLEAELLT